MPRQAGLFETTNGNLFEAFLLVRDGGVNIPPAWIDRTRESRKKRELELAKRLKAGKLDAVGYIREWEFCYRKECFYYGLRSLLDLQRTGKTKL